jgi:hypothetical protein
MHTKKRARGRPTKKTLNLLEPSCELIANGGPAVAACKLVGVGYTSTRKWLRDVR